MNERAAVNPLAPAARPSPSVFRQSMSGLQISVAGLFVVLAGVLAVFTSPALVAAVLVGAGGAWLLVRRPETLLGAVLLVMPFHFLAVMLGQFFGVPHMTLISASTKELPLLVLGAILWRRNGYHVSPPDLFLFACFTVAVLRTTLDGNVSGLLLDFEYLLPYFIGRFTVLEESRQQSWAHIAVWIAALLSVLGMIEIFLLHEAPRTVLYAAVTDQKGLPDSFHASAFSGMRAAATLIGPPSLGALCMVALVIWWVYLRNPIPAIVVGAGLICALTRSAWIGAVVAIIVLAFRMAHWKRLLSYAVVGVVVFAAAIPVLDMGEYLFHTSRGTDLSEQVHRESELRGINYAMDHPFGSGAGTVGPIALAKYDNAIVTENTYLAYAAEYGFPASLCFMGFLWTALRLTWRVHSRLCYTAAGILVAFSLMMTVFLVHEDFRLACWVWFPVGLAVRAAWSAQHTPHVAQQLA